MKFVDMKTIAISSINRHSFRKEPQFMLKVGKANFEFYSTNSYGRIGDERGLNITNWSHKHKCHVVTLLGMCDDYILHTINALTRETLEINEFATLKEVREFISQNQHNL